MNAGEPPAGNYTRTIWLLTVATFLLGCAEASYGYSSGSSFLIKDGLGWGYGTVIYAISAMEYGEARETQFKASILIAVVLAIGGFHSGFDVVSGLTGNSADDPGEVTASAIISFVGASLVAALLFRFRQTHDPLVEGSWLSARNDIITSSLDVAVALGTKVISAKWPQVAVDVLGVGLSFQAAYLVTRAAIRARRAEAQP